MISSMSMPAGVRRYTVQEYLDLEEKAEERHELWDGEVLAMSGGTHRHGLVSSNIHGTLWQRLRGKPCRPLESSNRIRTSPGRYVYPDASVVCGKPIFDPDDPKQTTIINPTLVIEVLSPSTESYDRGKKFDAYQMIETLKEYVLIDPSKPYIQTFNRQADNSWRLDKVEGMDATLQVRSLGLDIPLAEVFADVTFET